MVVEVLGAPVAPVAVLRVLQHVSLALVAVELVLFIRKRNPIHIIICNNVCLPSSAALLLLVDGGVCRVGDRAHEGEDEGQQVEDHEQCEDNEAAVLEQAVECGQVHEHGYKHVGAEYDNGYYLCG